MTDIRLDRFHPKGRRLISKKHRGNTDAKGQADNFREQMQMRLFKKGQEFIVEDLCPPLCHELWNCIYPYVYALQNEASLDYGDGRAKKFDAACPDEGRVCIHGEVMD